MKVPHQLSAALILSKYSLLAMLRSPVAVVFSLLFPLVFILVFGSMVGDRAPSLKLAIAPECDTLNPVFSAIRENPSISLQRGLSRKEQSEALRKNRISAILDIVSDGDHAARPHYQVRLETAGTQSPSSGGSVLLRNFIGEAIRNTDQRLFPASHSIASLDLTEMSGPAYKAIDFILPGQLGFSLLMAGVFGSSFLLFSLRQNMVLKRLRVTPVKGRTIIAGEMLSRLFFHIIGFLIMVSLGYFIFGFTLVNGVATFFEMLLFSLFGLGIFMGIGFIISGVVQDESAISPVANTVTLPQILLCGLFFPIESYPSWLQSFCRLLPLTFFVDGLRKIAFEGIHIWQMPVQLAGLFVWTLVVGAWSVRAFKWE